MLINILLKSTTKQYYFVKHGQIIFNNLKISIEKYYLSSIYIFRNLNILLWKKMLTEVHSITAWNVESISI